MYFNINADKTQGVVLASSKDDIARNPEQLQSQYKPVKEYTFQV